ncbi:hypothetical protein NESM_000760600 [Novymonas esmeraldas]|uniref:Uncharacterized protein n=1 Tax=Novymonas esmeraldas TaxID=1808958 RepID=A0AAW0EY39_9TRYP
MTGGRRPGNNGGRPSNRRAADQQRQRVQDPVVEPCRAVVQSFCPERAQREGQPRQRRRAQQVRARLSWQPFSGEGGEVRLAGAGALPHPVLHRGAVAAEAGAEDAHHVRGERRRHALHQYRHRRAVLGEVVPLARLMWSPVVASAGPAPCRTACAAALARTTAESSRYAGDSRAWVSRHGQAQCLRHGGGEEERAQYHALWHAAWRPELLHEAAVFADAACARLAQREANDAGRCGAAPGGGAPPAGRRCVRSGVYALAASSATSVSALGAA